ncbi:MAG TPA: hypothetical protein VL147_09730 [Devosia sp.]|nr:hypothetical protein [Devosia sp.]
MKIIEVRGVETPVGDDGKILPRRSNLWAVRLGFHLGQGYSSTDVARMLMDGTSPATVRGQARRAGILPEVSFEAVLPIHLPSWQRDIIARHAAERGLSPAEIIGHVLESALVFDDLYDAVTDGRYDPKPQKTARAA